MKKLLILPLLFLSACSTKVSDTTKFICFTAQGPALIAPTTTVKVSVESYGNVSFVKAETAAQGTFYFPLQNCTISVTQ